jgi:methionine synthase II (cobalamin-independent)
MATTRNHQRPPFRAEHMGSLLRPPKLSEKRIAMDDKEAIAITQDSELRVIEDEAIDDIVKIQTELGYHGVTDGEYRRHQFWGTFFPGLEGFKEIFDPPLDMFRLYVPDLAAFSMSSFLHPAR